MHAWPSSLRLRLTLWYTILLALPLVIFAIVCYVAFARALLSRTDGFIGDALTAFSRELVAERRMATSPAGAIRTTVEEVRFRDLRIGVLDSVHRLVAATVFPEAESESNARTAGSAERQIDSTLRALAFAQPEVITVPTGEGTYRVMSRPLELRGARFGLAAAYPLKDIERVLERIRAMFALAIPFLILTAATGGYFLAKRSLAPLSAMTLQAEAISAANFDERLPVGGGEELVGLARVVNDLLDRLGESFEQQRRFMADASHELRTPTAILRTEADLTLSREHRPEHEYRASAVIMQNATRRLTRIVEDLFLLARADSGHLVPRRAPLYLEEVIHDATTGIRGVADRLGVHVVLGQVVEAPFDGDVDLLGRLLLNLLDNAIKFTPRGGRVDVSMERTDDRYDVMVVDSGVGIPTEMHDRVFERFFRADSVRTRSDANEQSATSGAGLGLAIARRIAEMHGGRLDLVSSRPGRTEFHVTLPAP